MLMLSHPCETCDGTGRVFIVGGNAPDGRTWACDATGCERGDVTIGCEWPDCPLPSEEWFGGRAFCELHAAVEKADAFGECVG